MSKLPTVIVAVAIILYVEAFHLPDISFTSVNIVDGGETDTLTIVTTGSAKRVGLVITVREIFSEHRVVKAGDVITLKGSYGSPGESVHVKVVTEDGKSLLDTFTTISARVIKPKEPRIYAQSVVTFTKGEITKFSDPKLALGAPDSQWVSLGNGGVLTVDMSTYIPIVSNVMIYEASGTPAVVTAYAGSSGSINLEEGYKVTVSGSLVTVTDISNQPIGDHSGVDIDAIEVII